MKNPPNYQRRRSCRHHTRHHGCSDCLLCQRGARDDTTVGRWGSRYRKGQTIVIIGGASSVTQYAIQMARYRATSESLPMRAPLTTISLQALGITSYWIALRPLRRHSSMQWEGLLLISRSMQSLPRKHRNLECKFCKKQRQLEAILFLFMSSFLTSHIPKPRYWVRVRSRSLASNKSLRSGAHQRSDL